MKLSTKVLLLALLNVALLGLLFAGVLVFRFGGQMKPLLVAPAMQKMETLSRLLGRDLEDAPAERRSAIVERYGREYGITLILVDNDLKLRYGSAAEIPELVQRRLRERPPGARRGPPPLRRRPGPPPPGGLFVESTGGPLSFWVGLRMPAPGDDGLPIPGTLLMAAPQWLTSSFFFDGRPWLIAFAVILGTSVLCWLPFIRSLTASVSRLSRATERIAQGHFEIELPHERKDELGHLGASINQLSGQLGRFVTGQKRFLADVAHELCSPIARIQFAVGILERRVSEADREYVADLQAEIQHMSTLVNELLSFTKMGLQADEVKLQPVHLAQLAQRAIEREGPGDARLKLEVDPAHVALADPSLLLRALSNLLRNGLRYAGDSGPVTISSVAGPRKIILTVSDCGPGVPAEMLGQVFEPFRRVDSARTRSATGGVGLGLAIVKSCVEACQGSILCRNRQPQGFEVEITLTSPARSET